ncbi:ABC transporter substrate-binding protein [Variovorax sp. YR566]|uniref:ABC transporter substrate-binding protein n=1 Tax=Variovorax sp. YR566 TaxID=3450237 RepID=UPI003F80D3F2
MKTIRIRLLWHPQAQFAGYLLAQHHNLAQDDGLAIECVPLDPAKGPIDALLDGDVAFAVASPSHMLESRRAEELVFLLAIQQTSSLVYPVRRSAGVADPKDLRGCRIGVWPGHEDLELVWMLHRANLPVDSYQRVVVQDTVAALCERTIDGAQMTTYHELHNLEGEAGSLADFVLFKASDYGASLLKDGLVARRDWVEDHPLETQAVVNAVLRGWTHAFEDEGDALEICARLRPDMSRAMHEVQLSEIRALAICAATHTEGLGFPDPAHMSQALLAMHEVEGHPCSSTLGLLDDRFWRAAPAAYRRSQW